ncbi:MAG: SDR family oxidoreductase [Rhodothermales bacterium]|nr:SDR family oxidoreductase [Rhodothermales bacterium]
MTTLVTGATGLVGSAVVSELINRGESVRILRREKSAMDLLGELADKVDHRIGDVTDRVSVDEAMQGVDVLYHVAARLGFGGKKETRDMMRVNVDGTRNVVDAALHAGVKRMVHTSSIAALGRADWSEGVMDENSEWQDSPANTVYGVSKHKAELEVFRGIAEGLDAVMVNPSMIFGVGRPGENTRQLVDQVRRRQLPAAPTGGNGVVDVLDVAAGHLRAMDEGGTGERYILSGENLSWRTIIDMVAEGFGVRPPRLQLSLPLGMVLATVMEASGRLFRFRPLITREAVTQASRTFEYSNKKAVDELACTFRPFQETIERIVRAIG